MLHYLRLLIQITLAPRNGWDDIKAENPDPRTLMFGGFIPMCILSAFAIFMQLIYHSYLPIIFLIEKAVIQLVAIFITYYIAEFFFSLYLIRYIHGSLNQRAIHTYLMMSLSVLALMMMVINMVPFSPVLMLLPLYLIVVMRMAVSYLSVDRNHIGHFMFLSIGTIFAPPLIIMLLFGYLTQQTANNV